MPANRRAHNVTVRDRIIERNPFAVLDSRCCESDIGILGEASFSREHDRMFAPRNDAGEHLIEHHPADAPVRRSRRTVVKHYRQNVAAADDGAGA